jgi:hypothetical protein
MRSTQGFFSMKTLLVIVCGFGCLVSSAWAQLFSDNFTRGTDPGTLAPWTTNAGGGNWTVTGGVMKGGLNPSMSYGFAFITNNFTNFSVQAQFQFPAGAFGGGLGGRLNSTNGTHYAAWLYPENTTGNSNVLKLIRFDSYSSFTVLQSTNLASVGTNAHTLKLEFAASTISAYLDGAKLLTALDGAYSSGTVSLDFWSDAVPYQMTVDDVTVNAPVLTANADAYNAVQGVPLNVSAPGVLANDTGGNGALTATLITPPVRGPISLSSNGAFTYHATNNFTGTDSFVYRASDGVNNSNATVTITVGPNHEPSANTDNYVILQNNTLTVAAPGVLANDTDIDGNTLTASLVSGPANGTLTFTNNGAFVYTPNTGFGGTDSFTYRANDGLTNSTIATVNVSVLSITPLYSDAFTRTNLAPWIAQTGNWAVTNNTLRGGTNTTLTYGVASLTNLFTNYSVQATVQFPAGSFGGGIDACLNTATGARYSAWVYPEGSPGGGLMLKLIKFQTYSSFAYNGVNSLAIQSAALASVGTNAHTVKIASAGNRVAVFFDGVLRISETDIDSGGTAYTNGTVGVDFWTDATPYQMTIDDVLVASLVNDDNYSTPFNTPLVATAPGLLANDTEIYGSTLKAALVAGPAHGTATVNLDGSFTYTPTNNYVGPDSFAYQTIDGFVSIGTATVNITVAPTGLPENFDAVTAPALPSGWTTATNGTASLWITRTTTNDTAPNAAYAPDRAAIGTSDLISPAVTPAPDQVRLTFRHSYSLEADANGFYDGGVLDIKIGTNAFTDIETAGGSFVRGGYNATIAAPFGNPLAGRRAWSSNSVGFVTTTVNLPPSAAGQSLQFRWRCGTDNANGNATTNGWFVDTIALTNNSAPVLPPLINGTNFTVLELTPITVTNTATDADNAANTLSYTLSVTNGAGLVTNASISAAGVITWTPTEAQGPGTNTFITRVTDGLASVTNVFTITVNEFNNPPTLPAQISRTIQPNSTITVTNTGGDSDVPANALTYALVAPPSFAAINPASGVITLSPALADVNATYPITTIVTDSNPFAVNNPALTATNTFNVTVSSGPVMSLAGSTLFAEGCLPANNVIDSGETVTLLMSLQNTGSANTTNLVVTLLETNGVAAPSSPQSYGVVLAGGPAVAQAFTLTATGSCGTVISPTLLLQDGATSLGTLSASFTLGQLKSMILFTQNFDSVTSPALPAGWTTTTSGSQPLWRTTNSIVDTTPNAAFSADIASVGINELVSPTIPVPTGPVTLSFRHNYNLEANSTNSAIGFDGGVLEIKIGAGAFTDIVAAGGAFVSGAYNRTIDGGFSSPIANRDAWSGNSGGYVTSTVTLPAAASGQNVQFRWRCGTDSGGAGVGWRIDSIGMVGNGYACCMNTPPVLAAQTNRVVNELATLTVTNTATDAEVPPEVLSYAVTVALTNSPFTVATNASISTNGIITWTPTEAQGPGVYRVTTTVADNANPPLGATNSFLVTVNEVNTAPVLIVPGTQTIDELTAWTTNVTATDLDLPANTLTFALVSGPAGLNVDANGVITWTPTEAQGPSSNNVVIRVFDNGSPSLAATNSFVVLVNEINSAPQIGLPANQAINELALWTGNATAIDTDSPPNTLTFELVSGPSGLAVSPAGVITWTPTEAQGPGIYPVTVRVFDNGSPSLSGTNSFTLTVNEVNSAPSLSLPADQTIPELALWTASATAVDTDSPPNAVTFELVSGPAGLTVSPAGVISWTPSESQGPSTNTVTIRVVDDGTPSLAATNSFVLIVGEVNSAPVLALPPDQIIPELTLWTTNASAVDTDSPPNTLTFELVSGPAGLTVSSNGVIAWTPTEAQGPSTNTVTVRVFDDGTPSLSATNSFTLTVGEVNSAPVLTLPPDQTIPELTLWTTNASAVDTDSPPNAITFELVAGPAGLTVSSNGVIAWTPDESQGPGTNVVTLRAFDDGSPSLSVTNSFTLVVSEVNSTPSLTTPGDQTINELELWTANATAIDTDSPPNTLTFELLSGPAGLTVSTNGVIAWTPTEAQGPSTNTVTLRVFDDGTPSLSATNSFTLIVGEVNSAPGLTLPPDQIIPELTLWTTNASAVDTDSPPNAVTFELVAGPAGLTVSSNGVIAWTPDESQGPSTNVVTLRAFDDGVPSLSVTNSFTLVVSEVNSAPALTVPPDQTIDELALWTANATAIDTDSPPNTLTFELISGPAGLTVGTNGVMSWTPTEAQGPSTNTVTLRVFDDGVPSLGVTNSFTLVVFEVNSAPALTVPTNQTIAAEVLWTGQAAATDTDSPPNLLTFELVSGPAGLTVAPNGLVTWTPTNEQGDSTNSVAVRVYDDGVPPLSATNTFELIVATAVPPQAPTIESIVVSNSVVLLTWSAVSNRNYMLQRSDDLSSTNWTDIPPAISATGTNAMATDSVTNVTQRFYRVHLVP